jgi:hypothetical protein
MSRLRQAGSAMIGARQARHLADSATRANPPNRGQSAAQAQAPKPVTEAPELFGQLGEQLSYPARTKCQFPQVQDDYHG